MSENYRSLMSFLILLFYDVLCSYLLTSLKYVCNVFSFFFLLKINFRESLGSVSTPPQLSHFN